MKLIDYIIVDTINRCKGQKSLVGYWSILQGKRTVQTIQDTHLFGLTNYFGLFSFLTQEEFTTYIDTLQKEQILLTDLQLSEKAKKLHVESCEKFNQFEWNGWNYHRIDQTFWRRLILFIQTITSVSKKQNFVPIVSDWEIQKEVKQIVLTLKKRSDVTLEQLHKELATFLQTMTKEQAELFVHQLSGSQLIGLTISQAAELILVDRDEAYLLHKATLHELLQQLYEQPNAYPVLSLLHLNQQKKQKLSHSTEITKQYYYQGFSVEEISKKRDLKLATIQDHIVELALLETEFDLYSLFDEPSIQIVEEAIESKKTKKLKELKEVLPEYIDYFMIRLVLARRSKNHEFES
ncbi:helix-turn-helix domain-containing protein [Alkalihalobacillus pseudalcaliphilus]|uniref:helix-turn-helix domain-containing protein n=1 Tax=Alkalihalobacillus pseudalcaliphilus TaxID=79884 RepID=UPI00064E0D9B|nr:helix-turn-helix domain-containing protein [Alkalihalobacillus pseudalcaliphilus]KMK76479.1 hypothetical protein AB990_14950 [Alkalihalobacillus pseudalcaliphilus]